MLRDRSRVKGFGTDGQGQTFTDTLRNCCLWKTRKRKTKNRGGISTRAFSEFPENAVVRGCSVSVRVRPCQISVPSFRSATVAATLEPDRLALPND